MKTKLCLAGSDDAEAWSLVVTKEWGLTPLCTVSLKLAPRIGQEEMSIDDVHKRAVSLFSEHLTDPGELLIFLYNPKTGSYTPVASRHMSTSQVQVKFLEDYPWINSSEEPPMMEQFLFELGVGVQHLNRKFAGMAERRVPLIDLPLPNYGN